MTPNNLLSLRHRVPDGVLLDWLDLEQLLPARPYAWAANVMAARKARVQRRAG